MNAKVRESIKTFQKYFKLFGMNANFQKILVNLWKCIRKPSTNIRKTDLGENFRENRKTFETKHKVLKILFKVGNINSHIIGDERKFLRNVEKLREQRSSVKAFKDQLLGNLFEIYTEYFINQGA